MLATRRWGIQILRDILILGPSGKTKSLYGANMSSMQLNRYLDYLTEKGFLEHKPSEETGATAAYQVTVKGEDLLKRIQELLRVLEIEDLMD